MQEKQNKAIAFLLRGFRRGSVIAVPVLLFFFTVMSLTASAIGRGEPAMNFSSFLTILLFSYVIAYAQEIFLAASLPAAARWGLHFLIIGVAYFFIILKKRSEMTGSNGYLVGILLYVFAYAVIAGLSLLLRTLFRPGPRSKKSKNASDTEPPAYTSMFTEK